MVVIFDCFDAVKIAEKHNHTQRCLMSMSENLLGLQPEQGDKVGGELGVWGLPCCVTVWFSLLC